MFLVVDNHVCIYVWLFALVMFNHVHSKVDHPMHHYCDWFSKNTVLFIFLWLSKDLSHSLKNSCELLICIFSSLSFTHSLKNLLSLQHSPCKRSVHVCGCIRLVDLHTVCTVIVVYARRMECCGDLASHHQGRLTDVFSGVSSNSVRKNYNSSYARSVNLPFACWTTTRTRWATNLSDVHGVAGICVFTHTWIPADNKNLALSS